MEKMYLFDIPKEVKLKAAECCRENGYVMDLIVRKSKYPADSYLYVVIAHGGNGKKSDMGYVTWTYNQSFNSLNHGHYCLSDFQAIQYVAQAIVY